MSNKLNKLSITAIVAIAAFLMIVGLSVLYTEFTTKDVEWTTAYGDNSQYKSINGTNLPKNIVSDVLVSPDMEK